MNTFCLRLCPWRSQYRVMSRSSNNLQLKERLSDAVRQESLNGCELNKIFFSTNRLLSLVHRQTTFRVRESRHHFIVKRERSFSYRSSESICHPFCLWCKGAWRKHSTLNNFCGFWSLKCVPVEIWGWNILLRKAQSRFSVLTKWSRLGARN